MEISLGKWLRTLWSAYDFRYFIMFIFNEIPCIFSIETRSLCSNRKIATLDSLGVLSSPVVADPVPKVISSSSVANCSLSTDQPNVTLSVRVPLTVKEGSRSCRRLVRFSGVSFRNDPVPQFFGTDNPFLACWCIAACVDRLMSSGDWKAGSGHCIGGVMGAIVTKVLAARSTVAVIKVCCFFEGWHLHGKNNNAT